MLGSGVRVIYTVAVQLRNRLVERALQEVGIGFFRRWIVLDKGILFVKTWIGWLIGVIRAVRWIWCHG